MSNAPRIQGEGPFDGAAGANGHAVGQDQQRALQAPGGEPVQRQSSTSWSDALAAADAISALLAHPVDVDQRGNAVIVRVAGPYLGQRECPGIIDAAQTAFTQARGKSIAVLDLSNVNVFSAMGVGLCTDFAKRARERKLQPVLYGVRNDLLNQLRMFKIERVFDVVRSSRDLERLIGT